MDPKSPVSIPGHPAALQLQEPIPRLGMRRPLMRVSQIPTQSGAEKPFLFLFQLKEQQKQKLIKSSRIGCLLSRQNGPIERGRCGAEAGGGGGDRGDEAQGLLVDPRRREPRRLGEVQQARPWPDGQASRPRHH